MNSFFNAGIIPFEWVRAICWTLLHSVWQGLLAAVVAGIIILCTKHSKAVIRYNLLCMVFISFIICSVYTFLHQPAFTGAESLPPGVTHIDRLPVSSTSEVKEGPKHILSFQKEIFLGPLIYYTNKYASFIAGIWALFFFINFIKMFMGLHYIHKIRTRQIYQVTQAWREHLFTISRMMGIRKITGLKESALVKVPVVVGFLKPVILVPLGMFANLSADQVETILVHELAHVRRRDFTVNLMQRFAECVFFFNPFIAWLSSRIREEREACCDDMVMKYTSDKKIYVEALVSFRQPDFALHGHAMALADHNNLLNRVKRMITNENKKLNAMEKLTLIALVLAVTAFSFIPEKRNKIAQTILLHPKTSVINPIEEIKAAPAKRFGTITVAPVIKNDTMPSAKQLRIKNISENFDDDAKGMEVSAVGGDGKKYHFKKVNDQLTELSVDGVKINKQDMPRYKKVIEQMENAVADMHNLRFGELNHKLALLNSSQDELYLKKLGLQDQQLSILNDKIGLQNNTLSLLDSLRFGMNADSLLTANNKSIDLLLKENTADGIINLKGKLSVLAQEDMRLGQTNSEMNSIVNDLAGAGVIDDSPDLSFTLNYDELIVNGKKQSKELHEKLREKYIHHKKDHFIANIHPNSRSTDIYTE